MNMNKHTKAASEVFITKQMTANEAKNGVGNTTALFWFLSVAQSYSRSRVSHTQKN